MTAPFRAADSVIAGTGFAHKKIDKRCGAVFDRDNIVEESDFSPGGASDHSHG
jgi:hypothetical protein